jgi:hypothetical protein
VNDWLFVSDSQETHSAEADRAANTMFKNSIRLKKVITLPFPSDIRRWA